VQQLFDRYITVDWSASSTPRTGKDSIWICALGTDGEPSTENPPTRTAALHAVRRHLVESLHRGERVLVGFDFPYAYPRGFAAALGLAGEPWRAVWDELARSIIDDSPGPNRSNRFLVASQLNGRLPHHAYWGRPAQHQYPDLSMRRDVVRYRLEGALAGLSEWREVERCLQGRRQYPQSAWKLLGAGSVGSQVLTGVPVVARLRDDPELRSTSRVWPFEVLVPDRHPGKAAIIHAEIWPSLVDVPAVDGQVRDQTQVSHLATRFRDEDRRGTLAGLFAAAGSSAHVREEGWILGVSKCDGVR
jgi:precorrin-8X/cobalt-precorrin-8 methylmutase